MPTSTFWWRRRASCHAPRPRAFSPDGATLASYAASRDQAPRLWSLADASARWLDAVPAAATSLAFTPDGATLVIGGYHGVYLWDAR